MAATTQLSRTQIYSGGGEVKYNIHSGDNSTTWLKNQLVKLSSGKIAVVLATASPGQLDSNADITSGTKLFLALDAVAAATSDKVGVQRILSTTRFRAPLLDSNSASIVPATEAMIGTQYTMLQDATGQFAPDHYTTANPTCEITAVEAESEPWYSASMYLDSSGNRYSFVEFKILGLSDV